MRTLKSLSVEIIFDIIFKLKYKYLFLVYTYFGYLALLVQLLITQFILVLLELTLISINYLIEVLNIAVYGTIV